jgi:hypothetical protein
MIRTSYSPATYQYAHHMGSGEHIPAMAAAWFDGLQHEAVIVTDASLEPRQMVERAVAILRQRTRR